MDKEWIHLFPENCQVHNMDGKGNPSPPGDQDVEMMPKKSTFLLQENQKFLSWTKTSIVVNQGDKIKSEKRKAPFSFVRERLPHD